MEQLRQLAEAEARVQAALSQGRRGHGRGRAGPFAEDAAKAAGLEAVKVPGMSRTQPDPRLSASPEAVGAVFASPVGKVVGPFDTPGAG